MDSEGIIARIMPDLIACLHTELAQIAAEHTWYTLEERTHQIMRHVGQRLLQGLGEEAGSGIEGPAALVRAVAVSRRILINTML